MTIPTLIIGYNRPELLKKRLLNLVSSGVSKNLIFVAIDGPKNDDGKLITEKIKDIIIDFGISRDQFTISSNNLGCRRGCINAINWFFSKVEAGLIIEDDCEVSDDTIKFFEKTQPLLNNKDVFSISGSNPFKETTKMCVSIDNSRLLSEVPFFWGWFTSKSNWDEINFDKDRIILLDLWNATLWFRNVFIAIYFSYLFRLTKNSSIDTWDTDIVWHCVSKRLFCIYPSKNLVSNVGVGPEATNLSSNNDITGLEIFNFQCCNFKSTNIDIREMVREHTSVGKRLFKISLINKVKLLARELANIVRFN